jgi:uncharacterized membrane protein YhaH (DUF805 family)
VFDALKEYAHGFVQLFDPTGRETRRGFLLILAWCISLPLALIEFGRMVTGWLPVAMVASGAAIWQPFVWLNIAVTLLAGFVFVPAMIRRLHDIGKSGAALLIVFSPWFGAIWLFFDLFAQGNDFANDFGPDPRGSWSNR